MHAPTIMFVLVPVLWFSGGSALRPQRVAAHDLDYAVEDHRGTNRLPTGSYYYVHAAGAQANYIDLARGPEIPVNRETPLQS